MDAFIAVYLYEIGVFFVANDATQELDFNKGYHLPTVEAATASHPGDTLHLLDACGGHPLASVWEDAQLHNVTCVDHTFARSCTTSQAIAKQRGSADSTAPTRTPPNARTVLGLG